MASVRCDLHDLPLIPLVFFGSDLNVLRSARIWFTDPAENVVTTDNGSHQRIIYCTYVDHDLSGVLDPNVLYTVYTRVQFTETPQKVFVTANTGPYQPLRSHQTGLQFLQLQGCRLTPSGAPR